jgi:hypothetical protein
VTEGQRDGDKVVLRAFPAREAFTTRVTSPEYPQRRSRGRNPQIIRFCAQCERRYYAHTTAPIGGSWCVKGCGTGGWT